MDEQIFHESLRRIRWSTDRQDLAAATRTTLALLLRRPGDKQLLESLLAQTEILVSRDGMAVRQIAVRCVVILQSAKHGRLSRAQEKAREERKRRRRILFWIGAVAASAAAAAVRSVP